MSKDLPYSQVPGKIPDLFQKIRDAKVPDVFSHAFLRDTLGLKSNNDRALISILKSLGMLDANGKPTARYRELKNSSSKGSAISAGIKAAYAPLFESNENANKLNTEQLRGLISQVAGTDKDLTARILSTLLALIKESDLNNSTVSEGRSDEEDTTLEELPNDFSEDSLKTIRSFKEKRASGKLSSEFHFNIQVHLPNNGTEETYLNIFNALREAFSE